MKRYTVEEVDVLAETTSCRLLTYENCAWEDIDPSYRFDPLTLLQTKDQRYVGHHGKRMPSAYLETVSKRCAVS